MANHPTRNRSDRSSPDWNREDIVLLNAWIYSYWLPTCVRISTSGYSRGLVDKDSKKMQWTFLWLHWSKGSASSQGKITFCCVGGYKWMKHFQEAAGSIHHKSSQWDVGNSLFKWPRSVQSSENVWCRKALAVFHEKAHSWALGFFGQAVFISPLFIRGACWWLRHSLLLILKALDEGPVCLRWILMCFFSQEPGTGLAC